MPKKDKEIKRLRREIEILRAQLKDTKGTEVTKGTKGKTPAPPEPFAPSEPSYSEPSYVRADLRRSLLITAIIMATITALALSQPHWPKINF